MYNKICSLSSKHSGLFLISTIFLILLSKLFSITDTSLLTISCFFLIAIIGISHGSLDNIKGNKLLKIYKIKNKFVFYFVYILLACVVIIVWNFLPSFTLFVFLCLAAYHFGKEDTQLFLWTNYAKQSVTLYGKYTKSYYFFIFFKGFLVIAAPLYFHYDETINIFNILNSNFTLLHNLSFNFVGDSIVSVSSLDIFWVIGIYSYIHFNFVLNSSTYGAGSVIADGTSIILLNYFFTPLIAFTLYFCFLHSIRHAISLITMLDKRNFAKGTRVFIKKALPLTIITAALFLIAVNFLSNSYELNESIIKVIFIGLASLTFPHILLEYLIEKNERK